MVSLKKYQHEFYAHLKINSLIGVSVSMASYVHLPLDDWKGFMAYFIHFLALQFTIFGFTYLLTLHRILFYTLYPPFFALLSFAAFWIYTQDISITNSLIGVVLETKDPAVIKELISIPLLIYIVWIFFALFLSIKWFNSLKKNPVKSPLCIIALMGIILFFVAENQKFGIFKRRLPYSVFYGLIRYSKTAPYNLRKINETVYCQNDSLQIVFVLGETVRADHLQLNGYHRKTNPMLSQEKNLISFPKVYTPLTYTAISLPQILTDRTIKNLNNKILTSIFSVLNKAGYNTKWIGNQSLEKNYAPIVKTNNSYFLIDKFRSVLSFKKEKDLALLKEFRKQKKTVNKSFTTLHMMGSHWFYDSRYTDEFRKFRPTARSKFLKSSTKEQLINSYDNTIVYLDYFLSKLIDILKKRNQETILIYLADHGESLGENGKWMHAQGNEASKNPAMLVWFSDKFKRKNPIKVQNLYANKYKNINTDFFFHSVLDLIGAENYPYLKSESIFSGSRKRK